MSTAMTTTRRVRPGVVVLWVVQVLLASQFVMAALSKLSGDPVMVDLFNAVGVGQWLRYAVGVLELAGAIGLLVPRLCGLAALCLSLLLVGATLTNLIVLGASPAIPIGYLLVASVIAWFRRSSIRNTLRAVPTPVAGARR